jgi:NAD(P)-dependent dehydrogenase (short-subunit alcohol dehydrogenase family)
MTRVVVVTGASSGIGLSAAAALARRGDEVVLVGRNPGRLAAAVQRVREAGGRTPAAYRADFANLDEVHTLGERLYADYDRIDVLANNAGQLAPWTRRTPDGFDVTMQVNHLAGFLLSHLLLDRLRAAPDPRVITTSSLAEAWGWLDVADPARPRLRNRSRWLVYGASKQANILFTVEAARRWAPAVTPTCFFPGLVRTRFVRRSPLFALGSMIPVLVSSPKRGADTLVWLADPATQARPGGYYFMRREFVATPRATDPDRARQLWAASTAAIDEYLR